MHQAASTTSAQDALFEAEITNAGRSVRQTVSQSSCILSLSWKLACSIVWSARSRPSREEESLGQLAIFFRNLRVQTKEDPIRQRYAFSPGSI